MPMTGRFIPMIVTVMAEATQTFPVEPNDAGTRLDLSIARKLTVGRNEVRRMLKNAQVRLNKRVTTQKDKGLLLYSGSVVAIESYAAGSSEVGTQNDPPV